jgi:hypothetical protein
MFARVIAFGGLVGEGLVGEGLVGSLSKEYLPHSDKASALGSYVLTR